MAVLDNRAPLPGSEDHTLNWLRNQAIMRSFGRMVIEARKRASAKGLECTITSDDVARCYIRSGMRCALTSCSFTTDKAEGAHKAPFAPSIDRIDCRKGYTPDNIRLVCVAVNYALGEWGEEIFARIARGYVRARDVRRKRK